MLLSWLGNLSCMVGDVKLLTGNFLVIRMLKHPAVVQSKCAADVRQSCEAWWHVFVIYSSSAVLKQNIGTVLAALSVFIEVFTAGPVKICWLQRALVKRATQCTVLSAISVWSTAQMREQEKHSIAFLNLIFSNLRNILWLAVCLNDR